MNDLDTYRGFDVPTHRSDVIPDIRQDTFDKELADAYDTFDREPGIDTDRDSITAKTKDRGSKVAFGKTLGKQSGENVRAWTDRVKVAHVDVLGRMLPGYGIIETINKDGICVRTYVFGSTLGLGVLSTNYTGESFMYFVERGQTPMGFITCSGYNTRYSLRLAVREAYRLARLALQRGTFKRCFKGQYVRGTGNVRRVVD